MLPSSVTSDSAESCATIGLSASSQQGGECIVPTRFGGVGAWRARRNSAVFHATEIAAVGMLLFFRESVAMDILTQRGSQEWGMQHKVLEFTCDRVNSWSPNSVVRRVSGRGTNYRDVKMAMRWAAPGFLGACRNSHKLTSKAISCI